MGATEVAEALPGVLAERSRDAFERLLALDVRWGGAEDTDQTCSTREQAGDTYAALLESGARLSVLSTQVDGDRVMARLDVRGPDDGPGSGYQTQLLLTVRDGLVVDLLQLDDEELPVVELLYFAGCPNHDAFLPHLRHLLDRSRPGLVRLVEVTDDADAQRLRFLGSPSVRVDGGDVEPGADERTGFGLQCRVYRTPDGLAGAPPDAWILTALRADADDDAPPPHAAG